MSQFGLDIQHFEQMIVWQALDIRFIDINAHFRKYTELNIKQDI